MRTGKARTYVLSCVRCRALRQLRPKC
jgi:hypothetical protein